MLLGILISVVELRLAPRLVCFAHNILCMAHEMPLKQIASEFEFQHSKSLLFCIFIRLSRDVHVPCHLSFHHTARKPTRRQDKSHLKSLMLLEKRRRTAEKDKNLLCRRSYSHYHSTQNRKSTEHKNSTIFT